MLIGFELVDNEMFMKVFYFYMKVVKWRNKLIYKDNTLIYSIMFVLLKDFCELFNKSFVLNKKSIYFCNESKTFKAKLNR